MYNTFGKFFRFAGILTTFGRYDSANNDGCIVLILFVLGMTGHLYAGFCFVLGITVFLYVFSLLSYEKSSNSFFKAVYTGSIRVWCSLYCV